MKKIEIFDPAMCCSTGVCGPSIDPELMRIATVINSLKEKGIIIKRHGLSSKPQDFIASKVISELPSERRRRCSACDPCQRRSCQNKGISLQ